MARDRRHCSCGSRSKLTHWIQIADSRSHARIMACMRSTGSRWSPARSRSSTSARRSIAAPGRAASAAPATWTRSSRWARPSRTDTASSRCVGYLAGWWQTLPRPVFHGSDRTAGADQPRPLAGSAAHAASAIRELLRSAPRRLLEILAHRRRRCAHRLRARSHARPYEVPVADLQIGDLVLVRPGDRVPIDGVVVAGDRASMNR